MFTVSPSIYSADLLDLKSVLDKAKDFEHIHLDIDDGNFVKGISFGSEMVSQIAAYTKVPLDAHLEVLNPLDYVKPLCEAGVEMLTAHVEALDFPNEFVSLVHSYGIKAGLALNLKTPFSFIEPYLDQLDQILFVSVEADYEGLPFRRGVLNKVREAKKVVSDKTIIWVDGGINDDNLYDVIEAGADGVVIGRAVFKADDFKKAYDYFLNKGREIERQVKNNV